MITFLRRVITPIFRRRRMLRMERLTGVGPQTRVLDLGGSAHIWELAKARPRIRFVNIDAIIAQDTDGGRLEFTVADATMIPEPDASYDLVFSNSLIEHLYTWEAQVQFANEARRLGNSYWIQTPARASLIEPHTFGIIGHWLPRKFQPFFVRYLTIYGWRNLPDKAMVQAFVDEHRLLNRQEMTKLFPDAKILTERFCFFPKSYIAWRKL
jgi:hypothetical protein